MSVIAVSESIGPVQIDCLIRESHESTVEIASHPLESGAEVTDHAYIKPKTLELDVASSGAAETWSALVAFQERREPFTIVTGLTVYQNMLISKITANRNKDNAFNFNGRVMMQEVIIVDSAGAPPGAFVSATPTARRSPAIADRAAAETVIGDTVIRAVADGLLIPGPV